MAARGTAWKGAYDKATYLPLTREYLDDRAAKYAGRGYPPAKWMTFALTLLDEHYNLTLYEARQTESKYIRVTRSGHPLMFKLRFSAHKPNRAKEFAADCDFFVGWTHTGVRTTEQALEAVRLAFKLPVEGAEDAEFDVIERGPDP